MRQNVNGSAERSVPRMNLPRLPDLHAQTFCSCIPIYSAERTRENWVRFYPEPDQLWGAAAFTRLAFALRQVGRDAEAREVLDRAIEIVELQRQNGADNLFFWYNDAELGAMTGDRPRMLRALRNAIDTGFLDVAGCSSLAFESFRQDARFIELENEMIRRATAERREMETLAM